MAMSIIDIIEKKKLNKELTKQEIQFWIDGYSKGKIPDYQSSALLMAIRLNGMTKNETFNLTDSMMHSGEIINLSKIKGITADKHSTGGVGDKTSLALCPMVASLGLKVAKMSGRGLGFTGGTLDKLESIPGFSINLTSDAFIRQVNNIGMSIIGQSENINIADKKLYALRDVTGTVDSLPLIASSIMSKKLASGADCILLDVKYGSGSFMKTKADAEELAKVMVEIGTYFGKNVQAEITSMNQPLGLAIGNILEVIEAINTLKGKGPKDFTELCLSSGATMLLQGNIFKNREAARTAIKENIANGEAFNVFKKFVEAQGGDVSYIDSPKKFPTALYKHEIHALNSGYITSINTMALGIESMHLGAGRERKEDVIDPTAGIILNKKLGDKVEKGSLLLTLYTEKEIDKTSTQSINNYFEISDKPIKVGSPVEELITYSKEKKEFTILSE